jgi:hypothetical protein
MVAPSPLYNKNVACIQWAHNMTSKKIWHMELQENVVHKWVHDGIINVLHVKGRVNPADIFTKEMWDGAHFRRLRDSFMCRLSDFLHQSLLVIHHSHSKSRTAPHLVVPSAASSTTFLTKNLILQYWILFPYVGLSQPFLICQVRVVIFCINSITLFRQAFPAPVFMDARMGGVVPQQLLVWKFHVTADVVFLGPLA